MLMADLYKERYGAKYLGWSVVMYLYTRTRVQDNSLSDR